MDRKRHWILVVKLYMLDLLDSKHPVTGEYIERHAELPQDFEDLLDTIRKRDA